MTEQEYIEKEWERLHKMENLDYDHSAMIEQLMREKRRLEELVRTAVWLIKGGTAEAGSDIVSVEYENAIYGGFMEAAEKVTE